MADIESVEKAIADVELANDLATELVSKFHDVIAEESKDWEKKKISHLSVSQIMSSVYMYGLRIFCEAAFEADMRKETLLLIMRKVTDNQLALIEEHYNGESETACPKDKTH